MMTDEVFFRMREIDKVYPLEGENVHALKKVSLTLEEGEYLSVLGPSGSGKTTFALKLHELTGIPLIHLDQIWWKPDRSYEFT